MAGQSYSIPGVYRRVEARVEGFPRVRTDVAGFVGVAGPRHLGDAVPVDDWKSFVARFRRGDDGTPIPAPTGGMLDAAVRDFFANGGRRLWIVNVAQRIDADRAQELLNDMLGIGAALDVHGLELLLRQDEVSIVALPDLDALAAVEEERFERDVVPNPCFEPCLVHGAAGPPAAHRARAVTSLQRLYPDDDLMWAQRYVIERLLRTRWRWFGVFAPPPGSTPDAAVRWRARLAPANDADVAALYWPWLLAQDSPGALVETRSPIGAVAGIFAQVDLAQGPHFAPANRPVVGAVGLERDIDDEDNRLAYDAGVNVLRAFPGRGIQVFGARTLRWSDPTSRGEALSFVNARRCLSAIMRTAEVVGRPLVFEPNTPLLRIRLHQLMTDYLLRVFDSGALLGAAAEDAFFVAVTSVEDSPEGQLICEIGVALAAPAEFIVFRIGRETGVIETAEAA